MISDVILLVSMMGLVCVSLLLITLNHVFDGFEWVLIIASLLVMFFMGGFANAYMVEHKTNEESEVKQQEVEKQHLDNKLEQMEKKLEQMEKELIETKEQLPK